MASQKILLVEPKTKTSYPPLGLMKIARFHKLMGDDVTYVFGENSKIASEFWDKIYISSVFTYDFKTLIKTIHYYSKNLYNFERIHVGGISATLLASEVEIQTGIKPHQGLLDSVDSSLEEIATFNPEFAYLFDCNPSIDNLPPDFSIFDGFTRYKKIIENYYFFFATKGCPNKCSFCAVKTLEPKYISYIPIKERIDYIIRMHGEKPYLLLLDNNVASSEEYFRIIDEIKDCGFNKNSKLKYLKNGRTCYKKRIVDFNQGVDLRLMDKQKMKKMSEIEINPLRLAFDDISLYDLYIEKMKLAIECGIEHLSNYMLFNYKDSPCDLFTRMDVNTRLKNMFPHVKFFSFPMRYSPVGMTDRSFIGEHWSKREVRAVQLILNATHGIVSHSSNYFYHAFGHDLEHFRKILLYPYHYILNREFFEKEDKRIAKWEDDYSKLTKSEKEDVYRIIKNGVLKQIPKVSNLKIRCLLEHYEKEHSRILTSEEKIN